MKPTTITAYPVMLPTEKKTKLYISKEKTNEGYSYTLKQGDDFKNNGLGSSYQHLYLTSKEEIKDGDWVYDPIGMMVAKIKHVDPKGENFGAKKVIATTDKSLTRRKEFVHDGGLSNHYDTYLTKVKDIPQSFIKQWVESNGTIESVEVGMEADYTNVQYNEFGEYAPYKLKTTEDNCVIIHQEEKKMYSREEVVNLLNELYFDSNNKFFHNSNPIDEWIEENL